ncbi:helix-turn-helix transcriptional regulator [Actinomycetospora flava]|uniref:Helix-turn-helix transcriptional regulator n=1 Tax=Actinomycetospora flava TaxID=3129232 RepID=A0ABU8M257_9PSEU
MAIPDARAAYREPMGQPAAVRPANTELIALREDAGLSQQDLAEALSMLSDEKFDRPVEITKKTIGRWERGEVEWPQPFYRRLLAEYFGVAVDELGFRRPRPTETPRQRSSGETGELMAILSTPGEQDPQVAKDQADWKRVREQLGGSRRALAVLAEQLYPEYRVPGLENTGVIAHPSWLPPEPIPLHQVVLDRLEDAGEPAITGSEREAELVRPLASPTHRYKRYSHAVRDLAPPRLFENRLCFRLLDVDWSRPTEQLRFGSMGFFDAIDTNEAIAHEAALHHGRAGSDGSYQLAQASWRRLSFRKCVGDPFDLRRRPLMGAIGTLLVRGGESPSVVLHQRDGDRVAGGGSMLHLLPAGIFQPSSVMPESIANDFSIWRNIQRECAEEILGRNEYDGTGRPVDYDAEPFASMDSAFAAGTVHAYCLGVTLDALTLAGDILTVAVLQPALYDRLFGQSVDRNEEGSIPTKTIPFEANTIAALMGRSLLSPGAAAALFYSWQHRHLLLP